MQQAKDKVTLRHKLDATHIDATVAHGRARVLPKHNKSNTGLIQCGKLALSDLT